MKKILIAIDDSQVAEKVVSTGYEFCEKLETEIALISVADIGIIPEGGVSSDEMRMIVKNDFKKGHELLINKIFKGEKIMTFVKEGTPYEIILETAEEWKADLIILGTHGRTGLSRLLIGSVAEKVIRHSTKPLMVVPTK